MKETRKLTVGVLLLGAVVTIHPGFAQSADTDSEDGTVASAQADSLDGTGAKRRDPNAFAQRR